MSRYNVFSSGMMLPFRMKSYNGRTKVIIEFNTLWDNDSKHPPDTLMAEQRGGRTYIMAPCNGLLHQLEVCRDRNAISDHSKAYVICAAIFHCMILKTGIFIYYLTAMKIFVIFYHRINSFNGWK